jgi:two-component system response regulator YesN
MYRLLLVDDESDIREGLQEVVDFASYGFEVVGESTNGLEAVQACERLEPDLVVTDIRMPLMDGLTMCRRVQKMLPTTRFIILSGYDDFEYARQAVSLNCLGYLLKPISSVEFREMLEKARARLDEEFSQRRDLSRLREHFRTSLPYLREMLLSSLLSGAIGVKEAL